MNHTPGPWQLAGITTERLQGDQRSIEAYFIHIEAEGYAAGGGIGLIHNKPHGIGMDNARLISAAPELYALATRLQDAIRKLPELPNTISLFDMEELSKAITKAEGKG